MTPAPNHNGKGDDSRVMLTIYHWLTPILIVTLGAVIGALGSQIIRQTQETTRALARIEVQLAILQTQGAETATSSLSQSNQIQAILETQANHAHRITVLEQWRDNLGH